jgi:hypothetical protein
MYAIARRANGCIEVVAGFDSRGWLLISAVLLCARFFGRLAFAILVFVTKSVNTMPFEPHPEFKPPRDPKATIWRYTDFTKFLSLLDSSALFFSGVDLLGDPFEGLYPSSNLELERVEFDQ